MDDLVVTREDSPLQQDTADFAGTSAKDKMGDEPTENLRPRHCHKVFRSPMVR